MSFRNFTKRQWMTMITFILVNFCNAMCVSMQAPFYPAEAEKKGCVPSEYGLVFGIFELTVFIVSPIIGANLNRMGMKATLNFGIGTVGVTSILFGLLDRIENGKVFLGLSFALRIIEACGNSGFLTGSFSMIAKEFPANMATMFALLETFFGIGMIMGPTVGGALYELGGFTLPFVTLGGILVCAAISCAFLLPSTTESQVQDSDKPSMKRALKVPSILMACYSVACAASSLGFIQATLEPHLRDFNLSPLLVGSFFVVSGGCYGISAPIWGFVCDRKPPKIVSFIGGVLIVIAFALMGPLPILPIKKTVPLIIGALVVHGIGLGAGVVSGFADAHKQALVAGFPDTIDTYGLISGLWTSTFALGAFVGPTVAGILFDAVGFPWGATFIIGIHLIVVALLSVFGFSSCCRQPAAAKDEDEEDLVGANGYGSIAEDEPAVFDPEQAQRMRQQRRTRVRRRSRKYSEVVTGSMASSMARSVSFAYPRFMGPNVANSYRAPPPSMGTGAMAGSAVDRIGIESDGLLAPPREII